TTYAYDSHGNKFTETDPLGKVTQYEYDASNNVSKQTDPLGHVSTFTYDSDDRRLSETRTRTTSTGTQTL
ncbi:MAG TPA: hypothetical protein VF395_06495, partial [Polyangiaceae bacterium]